jgi:hypothetical protein
MAFDPKKIDDDKCASGHLDDDPIYGILTALSEKGTTGRLTIKDAAGENHMFFLQGKPVGVKLAGYLHPLGQMLLEQGRVDARTYLKAQRSIVRENRLPGQVYVELGSLTEESLKEVLSVQARRKAEHFCRFAARPFTFCRGLSFLTGFDRATLDPHAIIFSAVIQQMGPESREAWLEEADDKEVRIPESAKTPLPAPLDAYGFGPPEERFLTRLQSGWQRIPVLAETGTLPRDEMAGLLRYLELCGRLELREWQDPAVSAPTQEEIEPVFASLRAQRVMEEESDTFASAKDSPGQVQRYSNPAPSSLPKPKKKRKKRRDVPEPHQVKAVVATETRKEKTEVKKMPSIMIDMTEEQS